MARGAEAKKQVMSKILSTFAGSFMNGEKELRIPVQENGETVEIKVTLTAAKDVLGGDQASINFEDTSAAVPPAVPDTVPFKVDATPTPEEKERLESLIAKLGL